MPEANYLKPSVPATLAAATLGTSVNVRVTGRLTKLSPAKCAVEVVALPTAAGGQFEVVCNVPNSPTPQVVARTANIGPGVIVGQVFFFTLIPPYQSEFAPPINSTFTIRVSGTDTTLTVAPYFALSFGDSN